MDVGILFQGDLKKFAQETHLKIARGARNGAERQQARAKVAYRSAVRQAGLGDKVANAVRVDIFPASAAKRTHAPSVYVWTKAPKIIFAFSTGVTIRNREGFWLAIPTENTPRKGRKLASPLDVEVMFNQDLIVLPGRGGQMLGFVDVVKAKSGRGFRKATRQRTKDGREKQLVLMFVFVRQVTLSKRINWDQITSDLTAGWADTFTGEIAKQLAA